jgi:hypothetical protein
LTVGLALTAADPGRGGVTVVEAITGTLTGPGVECPRFALPDGELISLTGAVPDKAQAYRLTGRWARFSYCMEGRSFHVETFEAIDAQGD